MCKLKGTFCILTHPPKIYVPFYVKNKLGFCSDTYLPFGPKSRFFYLVIFYQAPQFTVGQTEYEDRHASRHGNFFKEI